MYRAWICETCNRPSKVIRPWDCPSCNKEICDNCGWMFGICKVCCVGKTEIEVYNIANAAGFDFTPPDNPTRIAV